MRFHSRSSAPWSPVLARNVLTHASLWLLPCHAECNFVDRGSYYGEERGKTERLLCASCRSACGGGTATRFGRRGLRISSDTEGARKNSLLKLHDLLFGRATCRGNFHEGFGLP